MPYIILKGENVYRVLNVIRLHHMMQLRMMKVSFYTIPFPVISVSLITLFEIDLCDIYEFIAKDLSDR